MICAVASAMPSTTPSAVALAPSVTTRNTGSSPWISSDEVSISSDVSPSAHTARGKSSVRCRRRAHPGVLRLSALVARVIWPSLSESMAASSRIRTSEGKIDLSPFRRPCRRSRSPHFARAFARRGVGAARRSHLHGEGFVRHRRSQSEQRQSRLLRARHPGARDRTRHHAFARGRRSCTGITICDEFFYSVLGSNAHYGQPINSRAPKHVTGGSSCGSAAAVAASCATSRWAATRRLDPRAGVVLGAVRSPPEFRPHRYARRHRDGAELRHDRLSRARAQPHPQDRPCAARRATASGRRSTA